MPDSYTGPCRGLVKDYSLIGFPCGEEASTVVTHPEGCSYPLCPSCSSDLNERWSKDIGHTEVRPATVKDMPGGFW